MGYLSAASKAARVGLCYRLFFFCGISKILIVVQLLWPSKVALQQKENQNLLLSPSSPLFIYSSLTRAWIFFFNLTCLYIVILLTSVTFHSVINFH